MDKEYIKEMLSKDIESLGCNIWGIELFGTLKNQTLRIYIDNKEGISIDDCEKVSKHVIKVLDSDNDFSSKYLLEVSSPGLERKFFFEEQYIDYINFNIKVRYRNNLNEKVSVKGVLKNVSSKSLFLEHGEEDIEIPFPSIIQSNLIM